MKINPGNARGLLVPQGDRPFSFVVYSSEIRDFGLEENKKAVTESLLQQLLRAFSLDFLHEFRLQLHGTEAVDLAIDVVIPLAKTDILDFGTDF